MHLAIAVPSIDGKLFVETALSALDRDVWQLRKAGHVVHYHWCLGESQVHEARNSLADSALKTAADKIIWVDADLSWNEGALARMVAHPVEFVVAAYLQKNPNKRVWNARVMGSRRWPPRDPETRLVPIDDAAIGLSVIDRSVFRRITQEFQTRRWFDQIHPEGEDISFCTRWKQTGGKIWCDPDVETTHIVAPHHSYTGKLADDLMK